MRGIWYLVADAPQNNNECLIITVATSEKGLVMDILYITIIHGVKEAHQKVIRLRWDDEVTNGIFKVTEVLKKYVYKVFNVTEHLVLLCGFKEVVSDIDQHEVYFQGISRNRNLSSADLEIIKEQFGRRYISGSYFVIHTHTEHVCSAALCLDTRNILVLSIIWNLPKVLNVFLRRNKYFLI